MKIAITGASGFIGSNLVRHLHGLGHEIAASDVVRPNKVPGGVIFDQVDLLDAPALTEWLVRSRPDVLFHLGARTDLLGRSLADYAANTKGVENIISACRHCASLRRVIFASSRMVCRIDYQPRSYDDYCPPNPYGESKVEGERIIRAAGVHFDWVMVRPTSIWGPGFGVPYRNFFDQVRRRRYFHPGGNRPKKSFGYIGNTIFQLSALMQAPAESINRKCFYLGDYEPLCLYDWSNFIHREFRIPGKIPTVPMPLLRIAGWVGTLMNRVLSREVAPLTNFRLNNLITNMVYPQLEELRRVTGDLPFSWQEGTRLTVAWLSKDLAQ